MNETDYNARLYEKMKAEQDKYLSLIHIFPMADRHTFDLASHEVEEVNKKERFHRNYAAITLSLIHISMTRVRSSLTGFASGTTPFLR